MSDDSGAGIKRRELLEASALLVALGGIPGVALAREAATRLGPGADPGADLLTGRAWEQLCDSLKASGRHILKQGVPSGTLDRSEGYRMLTRLIGLAFEQVIESSDADHPRFHEVNTEIRKYIGDNPDQAYPMAMIAGDRSYRISGNKGNAISTEVSVFAGSFAR